MPLANQFLLERTLKRIGSKVSCARRRRRWSQKAMAEQMGVSLSTVRRLEAGDPGVAWQHFLGALLAFGEVDQVSSLLDTNTDTVGLVCADGALPKRIREKATIVNANS